MPKYFSKILIGFCILGFNNYNLAIPYVSWIESKVSQVFSAYLFVNFLRDIYKKSNPISEIAKGFIFGREFNSLPTDKLLSPKMQARCKLLLLILKETTSPEKQRLIIKNLELLKKLSTKKSFSLKEQLFLASIKVKLYQLENNSIWPEELKNFVVVNLKKLIQGKKTIDKRHLYLTYQENSEFIFDAFLNQISFILKKEAIIFDCKLLLENNNSSSKNYKSNLFTKLYLERTNGINLILIKNLDSLSSPRELIIMENFLKTKKSKKDPSVGDSLDFSNDFIIVAGNNRSSPNIIFNDYLKSHTFNLDQSSFCNNLKLDFLNQQQLIYDVFLSDKDQSQLISFYEEHFKTQSFSKFLKSFFITFEDSQQTLDFTFEKILQKKQVPSIINYNEAEYSNLLNIDLETINLNPFFLEHLKKAKHELFGLIKDGRTDNIFEAENHFKILLKLASIIEKQNHEVDLKEVFNQLNNTHFGLSSIKNKLLDFVALEKASINKNSGKVFLLVGPPGVGKTSIAESIAKSLNKKFAKISCTNILNRAQLCGWPKSYKSAKEGLIAEALIESNSLSPVILFDEVDKIPNESKAELIGPLHQILDPSQNDKVWNNYLEINLDLSGVTFILSANNIELLPQSLIDRCIVINLKGYSDDEKFWIAKNYFIPKILSNLQPEFSSRIFIPDTLIYQFIEEDKLESGVRKLKEKIESEVIRMIRETYSIQSISNSIPENEIPNFMNL